MKYAIPDASTLHVEEEGLRVAGKTRVQVDEEMMKRLIQKIKERRAYQRQLEKSQSDE
jgi:hypothetical protein